MLIDLPVTIIFDAEGAHNLAGRRELRITKVCTLRFGNADCKIPAEIFNSYPPSESQVANLLGEPADGVLAMLSSSEYMRIRNRSARYPYDYGVGTEEERTAWQEEADEQAAMDGA